MCSHVTRDVKHGGADLAEGLDHELVQRARTRERAGDEQHRTACGSSKISRASAMGMARARAGIGRPTTW